MASRKQGTWSASNGLARAILYDRNERRKWLGWMILVPLLMMAAGLWLIDDWLWESPLRAVSWWAACALSTLIVLLFSLYDALAVLREEREKIQSKMDES